MTTGPILRLIADDLTGALDTAASFAVASVPIVVTWREGDEPEGSFAFSTETREASESDARSRSLAAADRVMNRAAGAIMFKKLDSLLRGHPVLEVAAIVERLGPDRVILAPAHPRLGRITRSSWQYARDLASGHLKRIEMDLSLQLGASGLRVVTDNCAAAQTGSVLVADAEAQADLRAIVARERARGGRILWCGSGGLAEALAGTERAFLPVPSGRTLGIVGSDHSIAAAQVQALAKVDPGAIVALHPDQPARDAAAAIDACMAERRLALLVPHLPAVSRDTASRAVAEMLTGVAPQLTRPDVLYCSGGETLRTLCEAVGAAELLCEGFVAPGIPLSRLSSGAWAGTPLISKSGAFGTETTLVELFGMRPPASTPTSTMMRDL